MLTTKITFALADLIRVWPKCRDKKACVDDWVKFVKWKMVSYKLSYTDKRIKEAILVCEY